MASKPLDKYPATRTTHVDEMREAIARLYGGNGLDLQRGAVGFNAITNHCALGSIAVSYAVFGTAVVQEFQQFEGFAQQFRIQGGSEVIVDRESVRLATHQALTFSPGASNKLSHSSDLEHFILRIDQKALTSKLTALSGRPPRHAPKFEAIADLRSPESAHLQQVIKFLVDQLSSPGGFPPLALAEFEQTVIVSFLCANRHSESHALDLAPKRVAPWQVRRAEEYIEANWDQPITIEALVIATGASARTLFHFFKESRGYSPMEFAKKVRLQHARRALLMPNETTSVANVAFHCGFKNTGHFAKDYGRCFGELPSETLYRSKGAPAGKPKR